MVQIFFDTSKLKKLSDKELLKKYIKLENQFYTQKYSHISADLLEQYQYLLGLYENELEYRETQGVNFQDIEDEIEEETNEKLV